MSCVSSENVLCKHSRSTITFYADLSFMNTGITAVSATADTSDASLSIDAVEVLSVDTIVDQTDDCSGRTLYADRAILITVSGGVNSEDEVIVVVNWVQSDGTEDSKDCRLLVSGTA